MTNIVLTEEEKKAEKICEEYAEKSRLFHEKYDKVIDDILHELSALSPAGYFRSSEQGDIFFAPKGQLSNLIKK